MPETELREPASLTHTNGKSEESLLTVIAKDDSLHGNLNIKGDGRVLGEFSGEIDCAGELMIGATASVSANIRTRNITISGLVRGNVTAVGKLKIAPTGRLEGDARVGALIVQFPLLRRHDLVEERIAGRVARHEREVVGAAVVLRIVEAVDRDEVGVGAAELARLCGHRLGEADGGATHTARLAGPYLRG